MKIADSVMVFNEIDLLKIRLSEHYSHVDQFFIVEATKTHSGNSKPLYFDARKGEFSAWESKIEHVIVDAEKYFVPVNDFHTASSNEHFQREAVKRLMPHVWGEYDYFIMSDLDEILYDWGTIKSVLETGVSSTNVCLDFFYYFIDAKFSFEWIAKERIRKVEESNTVPFEFTSPMGWHFSTLGGTERVMEKLAAERSHTRTAKYNHEKHIRNSIVNLRTFFKSKRTASPKDYLAVQTDLSYLPKGMLENWDVWKKYTYQTFMEL